MFLLSNMHLKKCAINELKLLPVLSQLNGCEKFSHKNDFVIIAGVNSECVSTFLAMCSVT